MTKVLDLSGEAWVEELVGLLQALTRTGSSRDALTKFIARYSRFRPVDHFVGIAPAEGGYRVLYNVNAHEVDAGRAQHNRDVRPEALQRLPVLSGGFVEAMIADGRPKFVTGFDLQGDAALGALPPDLLGCMILPLFEGEAVREWTFGFGRRPDLIGPRDVLQGMMTANLLAMVNRSFDAREEIDRLNRRLREQLDQVARLQQTLLPDRIPEIPGLEIATSYLTSDESGGDYYDFIGLPDGRWGILIADVSGHGAAAATVMAMLHAIVHCYLPLQPLTPRSGPADPASVLGFANQRLVAAGLDGSFVTAFFGSFDPLTGELRYANAGHCPPRVKCGTTGVTRALDGDAGLPLGILDPSDVPSQRTALGLNDTLVLYTDGIVEAFDPSREMFGVHRLDAALDACTGAPDCVIESLHRALFRHRGSPTRDDDQTLVAMRYHGVCAVPEMLAGSRVS